MCNQTPKDCNLLKGLACKTDNECGDFEDGKCNKGESFK